MNIFGDRKEYVGSLDGQQSVDVFQAGINRVTTDRQLGIAFIEAGEVIDMFSLDPGTHRVKFPGNGVVVVVECDPETKWFVKFGGMFNPSDPTRIEASLVRPRTQKQEMQDYMNELAARAFGKQISDDLRAGVAEFDSSEDDYSEEHEEDSQAPLSTFQLDLIMQELQREIASRSPAKPSSTVNETPVVDPPPGDAGKAVDESGSQ